MTVAESLRDKLRYNMMINHDSIEVSDKILGFDTPAQRELKATLEERLFRNETPHRMERKASKKDVAWSKANLMQDAENHKLNTDEGERCFENHMKKNTALAYEIAPHRMARKKAYGVETRKMPPHRKTGTKVCGAETKKASYHQNKRIKLP